MPFMSKGDTMRGLAIFIGDLRNCKSKESETKRINKELANIRTKFKGDKSLDGYNKKKYVCKLLFMFLLGHDIDFGHIEAVNLTTSNKYTEKYIGYLFISVLVSSNSELMKLIIQNIKCDISSNKQVHVNLALQCIANIGSVEMAQAFGNDVPRILTSMQAPESVKQSAALCFLRLFRALPTLISHQEWASRIVHLLNDHHLGVVTAAASLIKELAEYDPEAYKACVPLAVSRLHKIITVTHGDLLDYTYYFVPAPWLCVKLLKILQCYPLPEDSTVRSSLVECLETVLHRCQENAKSKKVQHLNAKNAILVEVIYLIGHVEKEQNLIILACEQLGRFLTHRDTNLRYVALEGLYKLASCENAAEEVKKHRQIVIKALKFERDVSVRQRSVDLLYAMCDKNNVKQIIAEMLHFLELADYSIREEMVLKVAVLSEQFAMNYNWYVDTILKLIRVAGDFVSDEVWARVIQIIVNKEDVQAYAARTVFENLKSSACHENMVKVGGFILGEYGSLIAHERTSTPMNQFNVLNSKYHLCSRPTQAILLSAYMKFYHRFPEMKATIMGFLKNNEQLCNADVEIQQRTVEYLQLCASRSLQMLASVIKEMPAFPERESSLLQKLRKKGTLHSVLDKEGHAASTAAVDSKTSVGAKMLRLSDVVSRDTRDDTFVAFDAFPRKSSDPTPPFPPGHEAEFFDKFLFKHSGVLHEDDFVQIGVKCNFKEQSGQVTLFFGNKTPDQLVNLRVACRASIGTENKLTITEANSASSFLNGGDQVHHTVNVECVDVFQTPPIVILRYSHLGRSFASTYRLPVLINKFFQPVEMSSNDFFSRWQQLGRNQEQCQRIFAAKYGFNVENLRSKISGFGLACLLNIDPNPENLVGSGIVNTSQSQIGCLLRLEPNEEAQKFRLTIRTNNGELTTILADLLEPRF